MHIPDSAISPATSLAAGAIMVPAWYAAGRRLHATVPRQQVPLLAVGSAFCFTVMMFNIPVPGGTTVHPVGGVLLAVLLGPWAAILGMTAALAIQALFFGDGGVLALGANSLTMALAMPVSGYVVYRLAAGRSAGDSPRRAAAAGIGSYVGINVAALLTAILLGIQPALYHDAQGHALYFVWGLKVTLPAMLVPHLTVAGAAEATITALAVRYLQAAKLPLRDGGQAAGGGRRELAWLGLVLMLALSPLGLLARGEAWGEWSLDEVRHRAGYAPARMARTEEHGWKGFQTMPDYLSERGALPYAGAGAAGVAMLAGIFLVAGRLRGKQRAPGTLAASPSAAGTPPAGAVPAWMLSGREPVPLAGVRGRAPHRGYVERTLGEIAETMRESVFAERWAGRAGLLQRLDPRAKIVGLLGAVVLASLAHRPAALIGLYAVSLALGLASRLPIAVMLRRVWLSVPLFVGAVTLPAALNIVTPGAPLLVLTRQPDLSITVPGLAIAALLTLRVGVAVSFVLLLTLTTRWNELLAGLSVLLVPRPFLVVLAMTYRYLAVFTHAACEMFLARRSRTVGRASRAQERRFIAGAAGSLFGRTVSLTEQVHAAMVSRGWTGEARAAHPMRLHAADGAWLACMTVIAVAVIALERAPH